MSKQLKMEHLSLDQVQPNPWNPNKQTDRQFEAEKESILANGFISPILVRPLDDGYEIIDGEHRWKALKEIIEKGLIGRYNLNDLTKGEKIPAIVLEVSETEAKKLTIIMNETRGRADLADMSNLLTELSESLGDELILGLPYTESQLKELMGMSDFNWDDFDQGAKDAEFDHADGEGFRVVALLSEEDEQRWKGYLGELKDDLPKEPKEQAGALIAHLMNKAGI